MPATPSRAEDTSPRTTVVSAGAIPPWLVAAGAAVIVAASLVFFVGGSPGDAPASASASAASAPAASAPAASATATPTKAPQEDRKVSAKRPAGADKGDRRTDKGDRRTDKGSHTREVPRAYVEVYNNSAVTGLASTAAARVQGAGWKVVGTDNWYGNIPETTVYYPKRLERQAELLAADLDIGRTRPAVDPMRYDRLTLILTGEL